MTTTVSQQVVAVEAAQRAMAGATAPSKKEREFISERLLDAAQTLRWVERNQEAIRRAIKAQEAA